MLEKNTGGDNHQSAKIYENFLASAQQYITENNKSDKSGGEFIKDHLFQLLKIDEVYNEQSLKTFFDDVLNTEEDNFFKKLRFIKLYVRIIIDKMVNHWFDHEKGGNDQSFKAQKESISKKLYAVVSAKVDYGWYRYLYALYVNLGIENTTSLYNTYNNKSLTSADITDEMNTAFQTSGLLLNGLATVSNHHQIESLGVLHVAKTFYISFNNDFVLKPLSLPLFGAQGKYYIQCLQVEQSKLHKAFPRVVLLDEQLGRIIRLKYHYVTIADIAHNSIKPVSPEQGAMRKDMRFIGYTFTPINNNLNWLKIFFYKRSIQGEIRNTFDKKIFATVVDRIIASNSLKNIPVDIKEKRHEYLDYCVDQIFAFLLILENQKHIDGLYLDLESNQKVESLYDTLRWGFEINYPHIGRAERNEEKEQAIKEMIREHLQKYSSGVSNHIVLYFIAGLHVDSNLIDILIDILSKKYNVSTKKIPWQTDKKEFIYNQIFKFIQVLSFNIYYSLYVQKVEFAHRDILSSDIFHIND